MKGTDNLRTNSLTFVSANGKVLSRVSITEYLGVTTCRAKLKKIIVPNITISLP